MKDGLRNGFSGVHEGRNGGSVVNKSRVSKRERMGAISGTCRSAPSPSSVRVQKMFDRAAAEVFGGESCEKGQDLPEG